MPPRPLPIVSCLFVLVAAAAGACGGGGGDGGPGSAGTVLAPGVYPVAGDLLDAATVGPTSLAFPRPLGDVLLTDLVPGELVLAQYATPYPDTVTPPFVRWVRQVWSDDSFVYVETDHATVGDAFTTIDYSDDDGGEGSGAASEADGATGFAVAGGLHLQNPNPSQPSCPDAWKGSLSYPHVKGFDICTDPDGIDPCTAAHAASAPCDDFLGVHGSWQDHPGPYTALKARWIRIGLPDKPGERPLSVTYSTPNGSSGSRLGQLSLDSPAFAKFLQHVKAFRSAGLRVLVNVTEGVAGSPSRCEYPGSMDDMTTQSCGYVTKSCAADGWAGGLVGGNGAVWKNGCSWGTIDPQKLLQGRWDAQAAISASHGLQLPKTPVLALDLGNPSFPAGQTYFQRFYSALDFLFRAVPADAWEITNEPDTPVTNTQDDPNRVLPGDSPILNPWILGGLYAEAYLAYRDTQGGALPDSTKPACAVKRPLLVGGTLESSGTWKMYEGARRIAIDALEHGVTNGVKTPASAPFDLFDAMTFHIYEADPLSQFKGVNGDLATLDNGVIHAGFVDSAGMTIGPPKKNRFWLTEVGISNSFEVDPPSLATFIRQAGSMTKAFTWGSVPPFSLDHLFVFAFNDFDQPGTDYGLVEGGNEEKHAWCPEVPGESRDYDAYGYVKQSFPDVTSAGITVDNMGECRERANSGAPEIAFDVKPQAAAESPEGNVIPVGCFQPFVDVKGADELAFDWKDPSIQCTQAPGATGALSVKSTMKKGQGAAGDSQPRWQVVFEGNAKATITNLHILFAHQDPPLPAPPKPTVFEVPVGAPLFSSGLPWHPYIATYGPSGSSVPVVLRLDASLRCRVDGDVAGGDVTFSDVANVHVKATLTVDPAANPETQLSVEGTQLQDAPSLKSSRGAGTGTIQCDLGPWLHVHAFDEPVASARIGWGFEVDPGANADACSGKVGLYGATDPGGAATLAVRAPGGATVSCTQLADEFWCDPLPNPTGGGGASCKQTDPPTTATDGGFTQPLDVCRKMNLQPGTCVQPGYPWKCGADGCLVFDDKTCGCTDAPNHPGGLYGCFAQGCYPAPQQLGAWTCLDACWYNCSNCCP